MSAKKIEDKVVDARLSLLGKKIKKWIYNLIVQEKL